MRHFAVLLFAVAALFACGPSHNAEGHNGRADQPGKIELAGLSVFPHGPLLTAGGASSGLKISGYWELDEKTITLLKDRLRTYEVDEAMTGPDFDMVSLLKHAVGYEADGKRYVEFGSFPVMQNADGKAYIQLVDDGGPQFFVGTYDVDSDEILAISFNGRA